MNKKEREVREAKKRNREARDLRNDEVAKALKKLARDLEKRRIFVLNYSHNGRERAMDLEWRKRKKAKR